MRTALDISDSAPCPGSPSSQRGDLADRIERIRVLIGSDQYLVDLDCLASRLVDDELSSFLRRRLPDEP
ncbi:MAG: hypothetical protein AB7P03_11395 [Kofleriaceae bacterium]